MTPSSRHSYSFQTGLHITRHSNSQVTSSALPTAQTSPRPISSAAAGSQTSDHQKRPTLTQARDLIESNVDGMLVVDGLGNICFVNPAAEELLGQSSDSLLGEPFGFPVTAGDKVDVDIRSHTEQALIAELRTTEITWNDQPAFLISLRDITERKQLENALSDQQAELKAAFTELEAFSHMLSHDLWSYTRRIGQINQTMQAAEWDRISDRGKTQIKQISDICDRTKTTIEGLLQFSRISHMEMSCSLFPINPLVAELAEQMQMVYGDRTMKQPKSDRAKVYGDRRLLRIVLDNLLENAWKYTQTIPNSKIEFGLLPPSRWRKEMPEVAKQDGYSVFFIRDNGIGFNMAESDNLFVPFRRLPSALAFEGSGIGLTTVQRIIHRHRGHIWGHSQLGKGTTFYFTLPTEKRTNIR